jgi:hypothetical protein
MDNGATNQSTDSTKPGPRLRRGILTAAAGLLAALTAEGLFPETAAARSNVRQRNRRRRTNRSREKEISIPGEAGSPGSDGRIIDNRPDA